MPKHFTLIVTSLGLGLTLNLDVAADPMHSVGDEITTKIKVLVSSCMGSNVFENKFIPIEFITDPQLSTAFKNVILPADVSFKRLATRIFDQSTLPTISGLNALESKENTLNLDIPNSAPMTNSTNAIYSLGCSSSLKLALDQGFSLPFFGSTALVKSSLNAEANGGKNSKLLIMYGEFKNPIASMLSPTADPLDVRVGAYAAVWRFMLDNSFSSLSSPGNYISTLRGWVVANSSLEELSGVLKTDASGDVNALLVAANLSGQASYNFSSKYSSNIYRIYFDPLLPVASKENLPNLVSGSLPTADEIISVIDSAATVYPQVAMYLPKNPVAIRAVIPGLGRQSFLCAKNKWSISSTDTEVTPSGDSSALVDAKLLENGDCQLDGFVTIKKPSVNTINIVFTNIGYSIIADTIPKRLSIRRTIPVTEVLAPTAYFLTQPSAYLMAGSVPPVYSIKTSLSYFSKGTISNLNFSSLNINCAAEGATPNIANIDSVNHSERFLTDLTITAGSMSTTTPDWSSCVVEGNILADYTSPDGGSRATSYPLTVKSLAIDFKQ